MSDVPVKVPFWKRINLRLTVFAAVILVIIGYPMYVYIDSEVSGGIKKGAAGLPTKVDLKAMSSFEFDQVNGQLEDVPKQWRELNGQKVELVGEIAPSTFSTNQLSEFELVYSRQNCCFSGTPQIQHFVQARLRNGVRAPYYSAPVKVQGTLHVDVKSTGGRVSSVYRLDVDSVEPVM